MQCGKQPFGSNLCGFYACTFISRSDVYRTTWRELTKKTTQDFWTKGLDDLTFKKLVGAICRGVVEDVVLPTGHFFDPNSDLATNEDLWELRDWRNKLDMKDYMWDDIDL